MNKVAFCTNDERHEGFYTHIKVEQRVQVDRHGAVEEVNDSRVQTIEDVSENNDWACAECGAAAGFVSRDEWQRMEKQMEAVDTAFENFFDLATNVDAAQMACHAVNAAIELDPRGLRNLLERLENHLDRLARREAR